MLLPEKSFMDAMVVEVGRGVSCERAGEPDLQRPQGPEPEPMPDRDLEPSAPRRAAPAGTSLRWSERTFASLLSSRHPIVQSPVDAPPTDFDVSPAGEV